LVKLSQTQRQMLHQAAPAISGYTSHLVYRPAYIATGDYHDFFPGPDGCTAIFLGDGAGHGPSASMLVASMRAILLTHPEIHGEPGHTLTLAGRFLYQLFPVDVFMTGLYVRFGDAGHVSWASAGHDPPLRVTPFGQVAPMDLKPVGLPLAIEGNEVYETVHWELGSGERLLLFTDGLVEARSREEEPFGRRRLRSFLKELAPLSLAEMVRELVARADAHREGADFEDDFTILGVERQIAAEVDGFGSALAQGEAAR
jgi:sigma-B regulation protein RsbU (phosphoserine phosphatase)